MPSGVLLYGATGFVGEAVAREAAARGMAPVLAGRDAARVEALAGELSLEARPFALTDSAAIDRALTGVGAVLHCAGPFVHTARPMVDACLGAGAHYLDITGEIPVYEAIAALDADAKSRGVMLLPGVGFDVVPTDCLAAHLKRRLPGATHLTIAFQSVGPGGLPPGTQRTMIEMARYGVRLRRNGHLVEADRGVTTRLVDFGSGPVEATRLSWGDIFMAWHSTAIPNIEDYVVLPAAMRRQLAALEYIRPLFRLAPVREFLKRRVRPGPSAEARARTVTHVWGEVIDGRGGRATSRMRGPEAGVTWTVRAALGAVARVLAGDVRPGFATPAMAFGPDFAVSCEGVTREDVA